MVRHARDPRGSSRDDLDLPDVGGLVDRRDYVEPAKPSKRDSIGIRKRSEPQIKKQISLFITLDEWKALRAEATARNTPMTELFREALAPLFERIRAAG